MNGTWNEASDSWRSGGKSDRKRVLRGQIAIRIKQLMYEACRVNRWWISEMSIQEDHVHIVVQVPPRMSVSEVVQRFKGGTRVG